MDLDAFETEDLLLAALKSEIDARNIYLSVAEKAKSSYLKDRLRFIADEEKKHREFVEGIYRTHYPEKEMVVPDDSPVPLPEVRVDGRFVPVSEVLMKAMESETAASEFYLYLAGRYKDEDPTRKMLLYFSDMEKGHFNLLQQEKERIDLEEDYELEWGLMHAGP